MVQRVGWALFRFQVVAVFDLVKGPAILGRATVGERCVRAFYKHLFTHARTRTHTHPHTHTHTHTVRRHLKLQPKIWTILISSSDFISATYWVVSEEVTGWWRNPRKEEVHDCNNMLGWYDQGGWVGQASRKHGSEKTYRASVGKPEGERKGIYVKRRIMVQ